MAGPIKIAILANAAQAKREFADVQGRGQKFSKGLAIASKAAAGGLLVLGAAAIKAGKAAAEDEASQAKLAQALRNGAGATSSQIASTESWITAQGKALGVADDQLRPALSKLAIATGSVSQAQKAASLAMNISTTSGKSLETVSAALAKAYATGSVTALGKYGVATKDAAGKTKSLAQITKELAEKYQGDAARAAETTAGKQKILTVQLGELQEQIGAKLLPAMTKLATAGLAAVDWATKHGAAAKILLGTLVGLAVTVLAVSAATKVAAAAQSIYTAVTVTSAAVQGALASACIGTRIGLAALAVQTTITSAVTKAAAVAQWALNAAMYANPIGLVVLAIVALVAIFVIAWKNSETFRNIVIGAWNAIKTAAVAVFGFLKEHIKTIMLGILVAVTGPVGLAVIFVVKNWGKIKAVTGAAWEWVKARTVAGWQAIVGVIQAKVAAAVEKVRALKTRISAFFSNAKTWLYESGKKIIGGLIDGITAMGKRVADAVRGVLSKARDLLPFSPAKKGPFSGRGWTLYSGRAISTSLADGIRSRTGVVHSAALDLAKAAIPVTEALDAGRLDVSAADVYASQSLTVAVEGTFRLSADQLSRLERGRQIQLDLNAVAGR